MKETIFAIIGVLAFIGLCLVVGLIIKAFDTNSDSKKEDGADYMLTTMGSGCGIIIVITNIVWPILALLYWLFS